MNKLLTLLLLSMLSGLVLAAGDHAIPPNKAGANARQEDAHAAEAGQPGNPADVSRTIAISMNDRMRFVPDLVRVKKGETIRFNVKNDGKVIHEMVIGVMSELQEHAEIMRNMMKQQVRSEDREVEANELSVLPGKSGDLLWKFNKGGDVNFGCLVPGHFEAGMVGKFQIE